MIHETIVLMLNLQVKIFQVFVNTRKYLYPSRERAKVSNILRGG